MSGTRRSLEKPKCACGAEVSYTARLKPRNKCQACMDEVRRALEKANKRRWHLKRQSRNALSRAEK